MSFSIIIPVFNEEGNISPLIQEILDSIVSKYNEFEIILINDGSIDNTEANITDIKNKNSNYIKIIKNHINIGQSFSISKGVKEAKFNTIVTLDGDGQNDPKDLLKLLEIYFTDKNIYLVGGIRKNRQDSLIKKSSSKLANYIRNMILKDDCEDTGCSLKVFDKKSFLEFPAFDGMHRFLPALFKGYQKKTFFIDVSHRSRKYGNSKYGTFKRMIKGIIDIIRVFIIIKNIRDK